MPAAADDRFLDDLAARCRAGSLRLTGEGGLLQQLPKRLLESALEGEMSDHLGRDLFEYEERWFDGLRQEFPFVRRWLGRNRLDEKFAAEPGLVRYALQEAETCTLECIAEARAERGVPACGIGDYVERARALHTRVREISPNHAVRVSLDTDGGRSCA